MRQPGRRGLQRDNRSPNPFPRGLPLDVAALKHQISASGGFKLGIGTMLPNEQVRCSPNVDFRDRGHGRSLTL
jgi:hypothetical protein